MNSALLVESLLSHPADQLDIDAVARQLGRYPRGMVAVGARCAVCGTPLVTVTRPLVNGSIPFPTTFYLTSPEATKAVSRLESAGVMAQWTSRLQTDEGLHERYRAAHRQYLEFRDCLAARLGDSQEHITGVSAGGMPDRVKCLHALVAQSLVMGPGVNPIGDWALEQIRADFDHTVCCCSIHRGDGVDSVLSDSARSDARAAAKGRTADE